ncbi:MAG: S-layer homology domain-containing protein [Clostridia bacterium]|nr:S-layer homology domain-containing protein [Clostridia bacterium]
MKKIISRMLVLALALLMMSSAAVPFAAKEATSFTDVKSNHWFCKAVTYVAEKGLMVGTDEGVFSPNVKFTRAMTVQVLSQLSGDDLSAYTDTDFPDVPEGAWFETAVSWAADKEIVVGVDGKFKPNDSVTREQLARMIHQFAEKYGIYNLFPAEYSTDDFADANRIGTWAKDDVEWAVYNGVISGVGNNRLDPGGTATRAQAAQLFYSVHYMKYEEMLPPDTKDFDALTVTESDKPRVLCWGDSMSQGYPKKLRAIASGVSVRSYSAGGDTAEHIAMKQGGLALYAAPFTIPAEKTAVLVPLLDYNYQPVISMADLGGIGLTPAYIAGIKGALYYRDGDQYYFEREEAGEEVRVDRLTRVVSSAMCDQRSEDIHIIYSGANNAYKTGDASELIKTQSSMLEYADTDKYIIIGFAGHRSKEALVTFNKSLEDHYGEHFLDFSSYLLSDGFKDAGIEPTEEDLQNIADGRLPESFRSDSVHGNSLFDQLLAEQLYKKLTELGYITPES